MKKQTLKNAEIDRIGDKVLKATRLADDEIEQIITSPDIFASIIDRVRSAPVDAAAAAPPRAIGRTAFWGLNWQTGLAALFVIAAVTIGVINLADRAHSPEVASRQESQAGSLTSARDLPPVISAPPSPPVTTKLANAPARRDRSERSGIREARLARRAARRSDKEETGEFQTVTYTDDRADAATEGRIVRVDLPRSSLYAMGIDVPVDGETGKIKTDLLIGSDGVMKAVRIVKVNQEKW